MKFNSIQYNQHMILALFRKATQCVDFQEWQHIWTI